MYINKNSRIVCHVAIGSENVNKRKWASLSKCSVALLRAKSDQSERSDWRKRTRSILIGLFWAVKRTANFCWDRSERYDLGKRMQPLSHCRAQLLLHKEWRNLRNEGLAWRKVAQILICQTSLTVLKFWWQGKTKMTGRHSELQRGAKNSENLEVA